MSHRLGGIRSSIPCYTTGALNHLVTSPLSSSFTSLEFSEILPCDLSRVFRTPTLPLHHPIIFQSLILPKIARFPTHHRTTEVSHCRTTSALHHSLYYSEFLPHRLTILSLCIPFPYSRWHGEPLGGGSGGAKSHPAMALQLLQKTNWILGPLGVLGPIWCFQFGFQIGPN